MSSSVGDALAGEEYWSAAAQQLHSQQELYLDLLQGPSPPSPSSSMESASASDDGDTAALEEQLEWALEAQDDLEAQIYRLKRDAATTERRHAIEIALLRAAATEAEAADRRSREKYEWLKKSYVRQSQRETQLNAALLKQHEKPAPIAEPQHTVHRPADPAGSARLGASPPEANSARRNLTDCLLNADAHAAATPPVAGNAGGVGAVSAPAGVVDEVPAADADTPSPADEVVESVDAPRSVVQPASPAVHAPEVGSASSTPRSEPSVVEPRRRSPDAPADRWTTDPQAILYTADAEAALSALTPRCAGSGKKPAASSAEACDARAARGASGSPRIPTAVPAAGEAVADAVELPPWPLGTASTPSPVRRVRCVAGHLNAIEMASQAKAVRLPMAGQAGRKPAGNPSAAPAGAGGARGRGKAKGKAKARATTAPAELR